MLEKRETNIECAFDLFKLVAVLTDAHHVLVQVGKMDYGGKKR
jgi:hypothetical protein